MDCGIEALAPFVLTRISADPATARMLIEQIGRERHQITNPAADYLGDRLSDSLADDVEASNLDCRVRACVLIERVLARDEVRLASIA